MCYKCSGKELNLNRVKLFKGFVEMLDAEGWNSTFDKKGIAWLKANPVFAVKQIESNSDVARFETIGKPTITLNDFELDNA